MSNEKPPWWEKHKVLDYLMDRRIVDYLYSTGIKGDVIFLKSHDGVWFGFELDKENPTIEITAEWTEESKVKPTDEVLKKYFKEAD